MPWMSDHFTLAYSDINLSRVYCLLNVPKITEVFPYS